MVVQVFAGQTRTSRMWESHFRYSLDHPPAIPWESTIRLSAAERRRIRSSIQEFQLGEQSEGRHLKRAAAGYARESGDTAYACALELFIREEQRHAALLGRFMDVAGIARVRRTSVDSIFRSLRRFAGLETSICVLLTAEVIARIYYDALLEATRNPALQAICRRILEDEAHHVEFQSQRVAILRRHRSRARIRIALAAQRLLFTGSVALVWLRHRPVLRAGGYSLPAYWRQCHDLFRECLLVMQASSHPE